MSTLITIGVILAGIGGFIFWLFAKGKQAQQAIDLKKTAEVQDEELQIAGEPHDPDAVIDRLHKHDF